MKTLAPCCEQVASDRAYVISSGECAGQVWIDCYTLFESVPLIDAKFCPWCGKRFEVVEAAAS